MKPVTCKTNPVAALTCFISRANWFKPDDVSWVPSLLPFESRIVTMIKSWLQNPLLKQALEDSLNPETRIRETVFWSAYRAEILGIPSMIVRWEASRHKGALSGEGVLTLEYFLREEAPEGIGQIIWM